MLQFVQLPSRVQWRRRGLWAKFAAKDEVAFKRHYEAALVTRARWSAFIAAAVMIVYSILDIFMLPKEVLASSLFVRWTFMILPLFFMSWASYQPWGKRHLQLISAIGSTSSGLAVVAMVVIARLKGTPIDYEGVILTTFYFYCCGGLRLHWGSVAGLTATIAYPIAETYAGLSQDEVAVRTLFLVSANIVGIAGALLMEAAARQNFAHLVELDVLLTSDPLTKVFNRRALDQAIDSLHAISRCEDLNLHIALIDVDYFKQYNDLYGHPSGDKALLKVATILQKHTQEPCSLAARYGGEEFICLWWGDVDIANKNKEILRDINALGLVHRGSNYGRLTLSIGALQCKVLANPHQPDFIPRLIKDADDLLYQAKSNGRNQAILMPVEL